jgi:hypothetical protein
MTLIGLIIILAVFGVLLWLVNTYVPMPSSVKNIINAVAVIAIVLWLLGMFVGLGDGDGVEAIPVPQIEMVD